MLPHGFVHALRSRRGDTLGGVKSSVRVWLDHRRIDVVGFAPVPVTRGIVRSSISIFDAAKKMSCFSKREFWEAARFSDTIPQPGSPRGGRGGVGRAASS